MTELINGRTTEQIKAAIRDCESTNHCNGCPYADVIECGDAIQHDSLALIERLESERDAALAKVPKWISVEEREPSFPCICYDGVNMISIPKSIALITLKNGKKVFVSDAFLEVFPNVFPNVLPEKLDDCTHILYWMPLPEPPEVSEWRCESISKGSDW